MNEMRSAITPPPEGDDLELLLHDVRMGLDPMLTRPQLRTQRKRRTVITGAVAALIVAGGGAAVATVNAFDGSTPDGRTYGQMPAGADVGLKESSQPDLVAVIGDHGERGYVQRRALNAPFDKMPTSPQDALEQQEARTKAPLVLDVYAADGTTKIDTFTLGRSFR